METIRILIYTDYDFYFNENPGSPKGGLSDLEVFTKHTTKDLVKVKFTLVNRHPIDPQTKQEINGGNRITASLLADHDEIWIFGFRQINKPKEPHNELDVSEAALLGEWMSEQSTKGGVFVTGDHSELDGTLAGSSCDEPGHQTFLGLGRALGYRIPRAGQLRGWNGPPTNCIEGDLEERDNYNTNEGPDPCLLDDPLLGYQYDATPQTIILRRRECQPHRLFWYVDENEDIRIIDKLPDHTHEGKVLAPTDLDDEWPVHSPLPEVAAEGQDKRFPKQDKFYKLVVAFDGDAVKIGRIVADSSFHHYLNDNLRKIQERDVTGLPKPGSDLDKIAHFFGNLAIWLSPKHIRDQIKFDLLVGLARHPDVLETKGNSLVTVGKAARAAARASIGLGRLKWLFQHSGSETKQTTDELFSFLLLDEGSSRLSAIFRSELALGAVMVACQDFWAEQKFAGAAATLNDHAALWQAACGALKRVSEEHLTQLQSVINKAVLEFEDS